MASIRIPKPWEIPEALVTRESDYLNRRQFITSASILAASSFAAGQIVLSHPALAMTAQDESNSDSSEKRKTRASIEKLFPGKHNKDYEVADRKLTHKFNATRYNNFYEFSIQKDQVHKLVGKFDVSTWEIEISGHCNKPGKIDLYDFITKLEMEERICRFRCVETWAMVVPWSGIPMAKFLQHFEPTSKAKYVRFISAARPKQMPGLKAKAYAKSFPYYEGLRMDEAMNELSFFALGMYGKVIPKQNGAGIRCVIPWKYGYKSAKSIVKIEFVSKRPGTFWSDLQASEYPFESNVDPTVPHPRWSQATERLIPSKDRIPTLLYNGYADQVAGLYKKK